jgi:glycosyltransferase involved in cell wall biosynthesis
MNSDFPRLLVATEASPNSPGGGVAVIRQMLRDWPAEKLYWWSGFPEKNRIFGQNVAGHRVATIPKKLNPNRRWPLQKSWVMETFWVPCATRHFRRTLEVFQPDVVWAIPHCWAIPSLARTLPGGRTRFHVSVHDYADIHGIIAKIGVARSRRMAAMTDRLYASSTTRDATSHPMVDDLRLRTGSDGSMQHAGLEPEDFDYLAGIVGAPGSEIRIAYAGTIITEKEFALFANTLAKIRNQLPKPVTLEFYGDHSYRSRPWFDSNWMKEHGSLPARELLQALKECSWGFSPMELTDDNARYNRFSFPTKFITYLAAGLPVITLGHLESSVVKTASQYSVGLCTSNGDPEILGRQLLECLSEPEPKAKYRAEIRRCATAEFDARRMRAVLYEKLRGPKP